MSNTRADAMAAFNALSPAKKQEHQTSFAKIEQFIENMQTKGAKVFEVHHAKEHARHLYQTAMIHNAHSPWFCQQQVKNQYPGQEHHWPKESVQ